MTESILTNLASHHKVLQEIGNFAATVGWTVNHNLQNVKWEHIGGGNYDFEPGFESYLELESTGEHGNQVLHFRFQGEATGVVADHEWVRFGSVVNPTGWFPMDPNNPALQGRWNTYGDVSLNPNPIPKLFLFGNSYFIMAVVQLDANTVSFIVFGSLTLEDQNETEGIYLPYQHGVGSATYYWFNRNHNNPFDWDALNYYIDGESKPTGELGISIMGSINNDTIGGEFFRYGHILNYLNSFSSIRPMMAPYFCARFNGDSRWRKVGELPVLRMRSEGYAIGEKIDYGGKEFRVFPNVRQNERVHGVAVRVG